MEDGADACRNFNWEALAHQIDLPFFVIPARRAIFMERSRGDSEELCQVFEIIGEGYDEASQETVLRIRFLNGGGQQKTIDITKSDLARSSPQCVSLLLSQGFRLSGKPQDFAALLRKVRAPWMSMRTLRPGWQPEGYRAFVMPDGRVLPLDGALASSDEQNGEALRRWRVGVAAKASGNPIFLFALCAVFAGPVLLRVNVPVHGYHFIGETSDGKSSMLSVLSRVWGRPELADWYASNARLVDLAVASNESALFLDELPAKPQADLSDRIYMLCNGRERLVRPAGGRPEFGSHVPSPRVWRMPIFSTGEKSVFETLSASRSGWRDGLGVRMADIHLPAEGLFPVLHGAASSATFVEELLQAAESTSGAAAAAFLRAVGPQLQAVSTERSAYYDAILSRLIQHVVGEEPRPPVRRVLQYFAAAAFAGAHAAKAGILPQPIAEIEAAVTHVAQIWFEGRGGRTGSEQQRIVDALKIFIARTPEPRLAWIGGQAHERRRFSARVFGWEDALYYYLTADTLERVVPGVDFRRVVRTLVNLGVVVPGAGEGHQYRMNFQPRPWAYRIDKERLSEL
ncbi:MAG: DUF927 domain-containing protein [Paracoccaceae bacterium]|nr:DUF927 domain-containing protein [Paracoccaceae bacterium]